MRRADWPTAISAPQGMEVVEDNLLFMTSHRNATGAWDHNRINIIDLHGDLKTHIRVPVPRASEGLAVDPATKILYVGFAHANSVHHMNPAYAPQP